MRISLATRKHIAGILSVQKERLLKYKKRKNLGRQGFLIYPKSQKWLQRAVADKRSSIVLVAREGETVAGYILAYDLKKWLSLKPEWEKGLKLQPKIWETLNKRKVIYGDHIARKKGYAGVGKNILMEFFRIAREKGYEFMAAEILEKPVKNIASISAHQKIGFKRAGTVFDKNNLVWGLYLKKL